MNTTSVHYTVPSTSRDKKYFIVNRDGTIDTIDQGLFTQGFANRVTRKRASHVLPCSRVKRIAFRVLRRVFGDNSRIAEWTRNWKGQWYIDFTPTIGGIHGPFRNRQLALEFERNRLISVMFFGMK